MSIIKKTDNWGYNADLSCSNWTGKTPRHSIGGTFSKDVQESKTIPVIAYFIALIAFIAVIAANFI